MGLSSDDVLRIISSFTGRSVMEVVREAMDVYVEERGRRPRSVEEFDEAVWLLWRRYEGRVRRLWSRLVAGKTVSIVVRVGRRRCEYVYGPGEYDFDRLMKTSLLNLIIACMVAGETVTA